MKDTFLKYTSEVLRCMISCAGEELERRIRNGGRSVRREFPPEMMKEMNRWAEQLNRRSGKQYQILRMEENTIDSVLCGNLILKKIIPAAEPVEMSLAFDISELRDEVLSQNREDIVMAEEYKDVQTEAVDNFETAQEGYNEEVKKLGGKAKLLETFGHRVVELSEPFEYCGKTYTEIDMNFRALKGKDMIAIADEMKALREDASDARNNLRYQVKLAARAAKVPSDMLEELPASDFGSVTTAASYFLMISG